MKKSIKKAWHSKALFIIATVLVLLAILAVIVIAGPQDKAHAQTPFQPGAVLTAQQLNNAFATAAITGGTINGAAIGAINPSSAKFTTLTLTSPLSPASGGTGVANNSASTLTLTGPFPLSLTMTGGTSLTLPTSGTVTAKGNTSTGSGSVVLATSPTLVTPDIGTATGTALTLSGASKVGSFLTAPARTITPNTYTVQNTDTTLIANSASPVVLTLPAAASFSGRILIVRTIAAQAVTSTPAVIIPLAGGSVTATILAGTAGKWAFMQSDGSNWQVMMGN